MKKSPRRNPQQDGKREEAMRERWKPFSTDDIVKAAHAPSEEQLRLAKQGFPDMFAAGDYLPAKHPVLGASHVELKATPNVDLAKRATVLPPKASVLGGMLPVKTANAIGDTMLPKGGAARDLATGQVQGMHTAATGGKNYKPAKVSESSTEAKKPFDTGMVNKAILQAMPSMVKKFGSQEGLVKELHHRLGALEAEMQKPEAMDDPALIKSKRNLLTILSHVDEFGSPPNEWDMNTSKQAEERKQIDAGNRDVQSPTQVRMPNEEQKYLQDNIFGGHPAGDWLPPTTGGEPLPENEEKRIRGEALDNIEAQEQPLDESFGHDDVDGAFPQDEYGGLDPDRSTEKLPPSLTPEEQELLRRPKPGGDNTDSRQASAANTTNPKRDAEVRQAAEHFTPTENRRNVEFSVPDDAAAEFLAGAMDKADFPEARQIAQELRSGETSAQALFDDKYASQRWGRTFKPANFTGMDNLFKKPLEGPDRQARKGNPDRYISIPKMMPIDLGAGAGPRGGHPVIDPQRVNPNNPDEAAITYPSKDKPFVTPPSLMHQQAQAEGGFARASQLNKQTQQVGQVSSRTPPHIQAALDKLRSPDAQRRLVEKISVLAKSQDPRSRAMLEIAEHLRDLLGTHRFAAEGEPARYNEEQPAQPAPSGQPSPKLAAAKPISAIPKIGAATRSVIDKAASRLHAMGPEAVGRMQMKRDAWHNLPQHKEKARIADRILAAHHAIGHGYAVEPHKVGEMVRGKLARHGSRIDDPKSYEHYTGLSDEELGRLHLAGHTFEGSVHPEAFRDLAGKPKPRLVPQEPLNAEQDQIPTTGGDRQSAYRTPPSDKVQQALGKQVPLKSDSFEFANSLNELVSKNGWTKDEVKRDPQKQMKLFHDATSDLDIQGEFTPQSMLASLDKTEDLPVTAKIHREGQPLSRMVQAAFDNPEAQSQLAPIEEAAAAYVDRLNKASYTPKHWKFPTLHEEAMGDFFNYDHKARNELLRRNVEVKMAPAGGSGEDPHGASRSVPLIIDHANRKAYQLNVPLEALQRLQDVAVMQKAGGESWKHREAATIKPGDVEVQEVPYGAEPKVTMELAPLHDDELEDRIIAAAEKEAEESRQLGVHSGGEHNFSNQVPWEVIQSKAGYLRKAIQTLKTKGYDALDEGEREDLRKLGVLRESTQERQVRPPQKLVPKQASALVPHGEGEPQRTRDLYEPPQPVKSAPRDPGELPMQAGKPEGAIRYDLGDKEPPQPVYTEAKLPKLETLQPRVASIEPPKPKKTPKIEDFLVGLSANTPTIPGIAELNRAAGTGDRQASHVLSHVAGDSLRHLVGEGATVHYEPSTGLYGGQIEASASIKASVAPERRKHFLAGVAKFAQNFDQDQVHVRQHAAENRKLGHEYGDGSYNTPAAIFNLKSGLSRKQIQKVIDESGLHGMTIKGNKLEAYYVGNPSDAAAIGKFKQSILAARASLGEHVEGVEEGVHRLWAYGNGGIPYGRIAGDLHPSTQKHSETARRIASMLASRDIQGNLAAAKSPEQEDVHRQISEDFGSLPLRGDSEDKTTNLAYRRLGKELLKQYDALPIKIVMQPSQGGEPYKNSAEMRKDVLDNNQLRIFATEPASFGEQGHDYSGHPLLEDSGRKDYNGKPMTYNDLLRSVHDAYAHTMSPVEFGPRGEEAAWKNHMAMTMDPLARWALTTETRGQNSWVNYGPHGEHNRQNPQDTKFAPQKTGLLNPKWAMTGDPEADHELTEVAIENGWRKNSNGDWKQLKSEPIKPVVGTIGAIRELTESREMARTRDKEEFFGKIWPGLLSQTRKLGDRGDPRAVSKAADRAAGELADWIKENPRYADFYKKDWGITRWLLGEHYGGFSDKDFTMFRFIAGLTSPQTPLARNINETVLIYDKFRENPDFASSYAIGPTEKGNYTVTKSAIADAATGSSGFSGTAGPNKVRSLLAFGKTVNDMGAEHAAEWWQQSVPVREFGDLRREFGYQPVSLGEIRMAVAEATGQPDSPDMIAPRAMMFGPKVGAYVMNSLGDHRYTTIDMWESRLIRSQFKGMFDNGDTDAQTSVDESRVFYGFIRKFNQALAKHTGHEWAPSAAQAARWYYMLETARNAGYTKAGTSDTISDYTKKSLSRLNQG